MLRRVMVVRCCYLVVALVVILVFLFTCFFHVISDSTCEGNTCTALAPSILLSPFFWFTPIYFHYNTSSSLLSRLLQVPPSFLIILHFKLGEWGIDNLGEQKNGVGRCVWKFGVTSVLTNSTLFMRETIYEGMCLTLISLFHLLSTSPLLYCCSIRCMLIRCSLFFSLVSLLFFFLFLFSYYNHQGVGDRDISTVLGSTSRSPMLFMKDFGTTTREKVLSLASHTSFSLLYFLSPTFLIILFKAMG